MRPQLNNRITIALVWAATLAGAYLLGSGRGSEARARAGSSQPGSVGTGSGGISPGNLAGGEGARPLSPSSSPLSATDPRRGGSAGEQILHLLGGAAGADLKRSEFKDLAATMSLEEVLGVIGEIASMTPGPAQRDAYNEVLGRWAQLDPAAALAHAGGIGAAELRRDATINVLRNWASVDPAAAVAFAAANPNSELPEGSLAAVFRGIGDSMDTSAALGFLASLDGDGYDKYAGSALRDLFERNDAEVIEWARSLPPGSVRDRSVEALVDQWARYDPAAAKAWLAENASDSNRAAASAALGESWARSDPEAATAWARELAEGGAEEGGKVLERAINRWMEFDFAAAAGYLAEQEPSPELDGALERYINRIRDVDADASMAWAEAISDPERRSNAIRHVAKALRGQDPAAFASYVASSPDLTDSERDKLLGKERDKERPKDKDKGKGKDKDKDRQRANQAG